MTGFIDPLDAINDTPALDTEPAAAIHVGQAGLPSAGNDPEILERVRELVLQAHREVVPELVGGDSLTALLASVEPARQAYANLAARLAVEPTPVPAVTHPVPAGGTGPAPIDLDRMPASEKLRRGILQRNRNRTALT